MKISLAGINSRSDMAEEKILKHETIWTKAQRAKVKIHVVNSQATTFFFFWDKVLLRIPGWSRTCYTPVSVSQVLGLKACTTMPV
jgi:hypothetical protein